MNPHPFAISTIEAAWRAYDSSVFWQNAAMHAERYGDDEDALYRLERARFLLDRAEQLIRNAHAFQSQIDLHAQSQEAAE